MLLFQLILHLLQHTLLLVLLARLNIAYSLIIVQQLIIMIVVGLIMKVTVHIPIRIMGESILGQSQVVFGGGLSDLTITIFILFLSRQLLKS